MNSDEKDICSYLKSCPGQFISGKEIARRASGKNRFHKEPTWAAPHLSRLVEAGIIESDSTGHYRLRRKEDAEKSRRFIAPNLRKILEQSKKFEEEIKLEDSDGTPG